MRLLMVAHMFAHIFAVLFRLHSRDGPVKVFMDGHAARPVAGEPAESAGPDLASLKCLEQKGHVGTRFQCLCRLGLRPVVPDAVHDIGPAWQLVQLVHGQIVQ